MSYPSYTTVDQPERTSWLTITTVLVIFSIYVGLGFEIRRRWTRPPSPAVIETVIPGSTHDAEPPSFAQNKPFK